MYCKRCDREDVGNFHRCFVYGNPTIRPLKRKPVPKDRNTPLARKMAKLYESILGDKFPGGLENAQIDKDYLGMGAYRSDGAWVWFLSSIDLNKGIPQSFGSSWAATKCAKNPQLIEL